MSYKTVELNLGIFSRLSTIILRSGRKTGRFRLPFDIGRIPRARKHTTHWCQTFSPRWYYPPCVTSATLFRYFRFGRRRKIHRRPSPSSRTVTPYIVVTILLRAFIRLTIHVFEYPPPMYIILYRAHTFMMYTYTCDRMNYLCARLVLLCMRTASTTRVTHVFRTASRRPKLYGQRHWQDVRQR